MMNKKRRHAAEAASPFIIHHSSFITHQLFLVRSSRALGGLDGAAGDAGAGVAGGLALQVVLVRVDDDRVADDRVRAGDGQLVVGQLEVAVALVVGLDVAEVAGVAGLVLGAAVAVLLAAGVVVAA